MVRITDHALAEIRHLCALGLPAATVAADLAQSLTAYLPSRHVVFTLPDRLGRPPRFLFPTCTLTDESALDVFADTESYLALERTVDAGIDGLMHAGRPMRNSAEYGARLRETPMYDQVFRPLELNTWVRSAMRRDGRGLGLLFVSRPAGEPAYTPREEERMRAILPYVTHAMGVVDGAVVEDWRPGDDQGQIVADRPGRELHLCPMAQVLRRMLIHPEGIGGVAQADLWRRALAELARRVALLHDGAAAPAPFWRHDNPWGRFELQARPLLPVADGDLLLAFQIRRFRPAQTRMIRALAGFTLSPRLRQATVLLAMGSSNTDIALRLNLRPNTVAGMVKEIYGHLDVHDRAALRERLLGGG